MNDTQFDLVAITGILKRNRKTLIISMLAAMVVAAIVYLIKPKKYEGKTEFYIANPLYNDRGNVFKNDVALLVPYFGDENTVDKVLSMAKSDAVIDAVADKQQLYDYYKLKKDNPKDVYKMRQLFKDNREITRTEYYTVEVSFKDKNPERAASITNEIVAQTNAHFTGFFEGIKANVVKGVIDKTTQLDSTIQALTDTLAQLRNTYGIYQILSPNRETISSGTVSGRGDVGYGMEAIQNVEAVKDEMVKSRAQYTSIVNQYNATGTHHAMQMLQPIYQAIPPVKPAGLGLALTAMAAGLAVFFFAALYVLLRHYFRQA